MSLNFLGDELVFPPVEAAESDGLLAVGGDLSAERLLLAYRNGIFPWYNKEDPILWWCPDPRFVLFPENIRISKSMQTLIKRNHFDFTINKDFKQVIANCSTVNRKDQAGTWIIDELIDAYTDLYYKGFAHSAETWNNDELIGGLYGVRLGKVFFGESMFSKESNASKFAFIKYVQYLQEQHVELIDCQMYTKHLESLGAGMIKRETFLNLLSKLIN